MKKLLLASATTFALIQGASAQNNVITPNSTDLIQLTSPLRNNGSLTYTTPSLLNTSPSFSGTVTFPDAGTWSASGISGLTKFNMGGGSTAFTFSVKIADGSGSQNLFAGTTKGVRLYTTSASTIFEGVDNSGVGSFQPLTLGGSAVLFTASGTSVGDYGSTTAGTCPLKNDVVLPNIGTDTGQTATATVCEDTTTHKLYFGSGAAGVCKGTSSIRFKDGLAPLTAGLDDLMKLQTVSYYLKPGYGDTSRKLYGFTAEQMHDVLPELVWVDGQERPTSIDWAGLTPVLVNAIQELKTEFEAYKKAHP